MKERLSCLRKLESLLTVCLMFGLVTRCCRYVRFWTTIQATTHTCVLFITHTTRQCKWSSCQIDRGHFTAIRGPRANVSRAEARELGDRNLGKSCPVQGNWCQMAVEGARSVLVDTPWMSAGSGGR